ncbi:MAG: hypothetical protein SFU83_22090 [Meiothermus sp.]|nr:hypothetical protein [Meiothermus sp.]
MSVEELLAQVEPLLQSDKPEDTRQAIRTLIAAKPQFGPEEQARIDDLLSGTLETFRDPAWDQEDDGIPTLDTKTGKWTNVDKLEG